MPEYNFHNFDDHEFELLCRDLINEEQRLIVKSDHGLTVREKIHLHFTSYKRGADQGIDLHFLYEKEKIEVVGQVKLSRGKFQDVFSTIKKRTNGKNELDKVRKLNPSKYVFMTSVPLSLANKETIRSHFYPYIKSNGDIYGLEDLNRLIGQFGWIEKRYLKLYFHSPLILENLLNKATLSKSAFELKEIKEEFPFFVQTSHFGRALTTLENERILIIKGPPGAGKTTLAKMLSLHFATRDYQFITIDNIDNELERLLEEEGNAIYYYDDFLGSNNLILKDALRNEGKLSRLIQRISRSRTKYLVLTSRTTIINSATSVSDKLREVFGRIQKFELDLGSLEFKEKRVILMRHIERAGIPSSAFSTELINFIINYQTFSPRLIQFIANRYESNKHDYEDFVRKSIMFPEEIWRTAYRTEIDFTSQIFLNHLFLFGFDYDISGFKSSFENRISFETTINNFTQTGLEFKNSFERLDGAFVNVQPYLSEDFLIKFLNPSIVDFLLKEIRENSYIIKNSIKSFDDINLLIKRFNHHNKELNLLFQNDELEGILLGKIPSNLFVEEFDKIEFLKILPHYFSIDKIEKRYSELIYTCLHVDLFEAAYDYIGFLKKYGESTLIKEFIANNLNVLAEAFFGRCEYQFDFDETINLFEELGYKINELLNKIDVTIFSEAFARIVQDRIDHLIFIKSEYLSSQEEVDEIILEVQNEFDKYSDYFNVSSLISHKIACIDLGHIINYNLKRFSGNEF